MAEGTVSDWGSVGFSLEGETADAPINEDDLNQAIVPPALLDLERSEEIAGMAPADRIERLLANMLPFRRTLLALVAACEKARGFEALSLLVDGRQKGAKSVYTADNFLAMLVEAGALVVVTGDGAPYVPAEVEPIEVERDGITYLEVAEPPAVFWRATDAGMQALADNDALQELEELFGENEELLPAFTLLLELCSNSGGAGIDGLKDAINDRPEMVARKKTAQFLLDYLLNAGAVYYDADAKGWRTSEVGEQALQMLEAREG